MINGTDQLGIINQHINTSRHTLDTLHQRRENANQQLVQLRNQMSEAYRSLARFRLDELAANQVTTQLDTTDRAVLKLLERRDQALQGLAPGIRQSDARQSELNAERAVAIRKRDDLIKQIDERAADVKSQLSKQAPYQALITRVAEETAKAERADRKATQAEADRIEKGTQYRGDPLFIYLWERHFMTPDYAGSGLTRRLDGWVAKLIGYGDARSNYYMLTELPVRLREHAERQKKIADEAVRALQAMEVEALNVDEILRTKEALEATQDALEKVETRIEEEEAHYDALLQRRSKLSSGEDDISRQAIEMQVSEIKNASLADLYMQAKMTPQPDDDVIVSRIRDLQQEEKNVEDEIHALQTEERQQQQSYRELEELRRRYRRRGYDSRHSQFPGGFEVGALLAMLMSGKTTGRDVWDRIDREQQFRKPRTPRGFGGGMFPGGFGGGGFGTGGGFGGGGGGFRTGGGF
jgi:chromosome segregation ATPase